MSRNTLSSIDNPTLSSQDVHWNTLLPRSSVSETAVATSLRGLQCDTALPNFSLTNMLLVHGERMDERPLLRMLVLKTLTSAGLCVLPRHTSPMITQPSSRRCVKGALWGPLRCSRTLCTRSMSRPRSKRIAAVMIFINNTLFNLAPWFKLYFSFRESYDLILIWSIDINQIVQLIPYRTIVQRVVRFQYIWEILFILVATI